MKKSILILALGFATISLASCKEKEVKPQIVEDIIDKYNKDAFVEKNDKLNLSKLNVKKLTIPEGYKRATFAVDEMGEILQNAGIVKVINNEGYFGFYSTVYEQFVIAPIYQTEEFDGTTNSITLLEIKDLPSALYNAFKIDYNNKTTIVDYYGNVLYEGKLLYYSDLNFNVIPYRGSLMVKLTIKGVEKQYVLDENYKIKDAKLEIETPTPYYSVNLKDYGYEDYKFRAYYDGYCEVYDSSDKLVNSYYSVVSPKYIDESCMFGGQIIIQSTYNIDDENEEYDFTADDDKFILETYKYDLFKNELMPIENFNYILGSTEAIKDETGVYKYLYAEVSTIENKIARFSNRAYLFDSEFNIISDYSNSIYNCSTILENGCIIDHISESVYDKDKNLIVSSSMNEFIENVFFNKEIYVKVNRKTNTSIVNKFDGTNLFIGLADEIIYDDVSPYFIVSKDDGSVLEYRDINDGKVVKTIDSVAHYDFEVEYITKEDRRLIITFAKEKNNYIADLSLNEYLLAGSLEDGDVCEVVPYFVPGTFSPTLMRLSKSCNNNLLISLTELPTAKITTYGSEKHEAFELGNSLYTPLAITLDEELKIEKTETFRRQKYLAFTPTKTGIYSITKTENLTFVGTLIENVFTDEENFERISNNYILVEGATYIVTTADLNEASIQISLVSEASEILAEPETIEDVVTGTPHISLRLISDVKESGLYKLTETGVTSKMYLIKDGRISLTSYMVHGGEEYASLKEGETYLYVVVSENGDPYTITKPEFDPSAQISYKITNDSRFPWIIDEETGNFKSTNHENSSTSTLKIEVEKVSKVSFDYKCDCEGGNYDRLVVKINGNVVLEKSGTESGSFTQNMNADRRNTIEICYIKDQSQSQRSDTVEITNFKIENNA